MKNMNLLSLLSVSLLVLGCNGMYVYDDGANDDDGLNTNNTINDNNTTNANEQWTCTPLNYKEGSKGLSNNKLRNVTACTSNQDTRRIKVKGLEYSGYSLNFCIFVLKVTGPRQTTVEKADQKSCQNISSSSGGEAIFIADASSDFNFNYVVVLSASDRYAYIEFRASGKSYSTYRSNDHLEVPPGAEGDIR